MTRFFKEHVASLQEITDLIKAVDSMKSCPGAGNFNIITVFPGAYRCGKSWVSQTCDQILNEHLICGPCCRLKELLVHAASRKIHDKQNNQLKRCHPISNLKKISRESARANKWSAQARLRKRRLDRALAKNKELKEEIKTFKAKFKKAEIHELESAITRSSCLSPNLKLALFQAVCHQKVSGKNGKR